MVGTVCNAEAGIPWAQQPMFYLYSLLLLPWGCTLAVRNVKTEAGLIPGVAVTLSKDKSLNKTVVFFTFIKRVNGYSAWCNGFIACKFTKLHWYFEPFSNLFIQVWNWEVQKHSVKNFVQYLEISGYWICFFQQIFYFHNLEMEQSGGN